MDQPVSETTHFDASPPERGSFLRRRLTEPLLNQLTQGASPVQLARSVGWGFVLGIFPILGTTTTLCGIAGVAFRLNHIALQAVNWLVYPLQILLIIPFLRLGNLLFGLDPFPLSLTEITALFEADFWGSLRNLGGLALRGVVAWALVAMPAVILFRLVLTPVFTRIARTLPSRGVPRP